MTGNDERCGHMNAARVQAGLTVQSLWLRYVALGGNGDAFDVDGYLQGLAPLDALQQDVLAQALNEALEDSYQTYRVPLSLQPPDARDEELERIIETSGKEGSLSPGQAILLSRAPDPSADRSQVRAMLLDHFGRAGLDALPLSDASKALLPLFSC